MPNCGKTGDQTCGEVRKIGFRASVLRTPDGSEVIVPNSELTGLRVINWSLSDRLGRISISVSAAYGTSMILLRTATGAVFVNANWVACQFAISRSSVGSSALSPWNWSPASRSRQRPGLRTSAIAIRHR